MENALIAVTTMRMPCDAIVVADAIMETCYMSEKEPESSERHRDHILGVDLESTQLT